MGSRAVAWAASFAVCLVAGAAPAPAVEAPAPGPSAAIAIAVAPFERRTGPDAPLPAIDQLLADRIASQGEQKVVGPADLGVAADAEPDAETVQAWLRQAGAGALVVGRITRIGTPISVDLRLRSATGEVVGAYVAEVRKPEQLESVVNDLAQQVLAGVSGIANAGPPAVSAAPAKSGDSMLGIDLDSGSPISIRADKLESERSKGARKMLFTGNVVVVQDDVTIHSNRLEAFYPPEASEPERMIATGRVRMTNPDNQASCDRAVYERSKDLLVCRGNAELREGKDCVAGEWIEFDLETETVKVGGGAKVVIGGDGPSQSGRCR